MFTVAWKAPNYKVPPRPCEGYEFDNKYIALRVADSLNLQTSGASGRYIVINEHGRRTS